MSCWLLSYPEFPWDRKLLQGDQTWSWATRSQPQWPEDSCHRSLRVTGKQREMTFINERHYINILNFSDFTVTKRILTFASIGGNLGERVVTAVTLASDDAGFTLTLAALSVARPGERAHWVTVAQETRVAAFRAEMIILEGWQETGSADLHGTVCWLG